MAKRFFSRPLAGLAAAAAALLVLAGQAGANPSMLIDIRSGKVLAHEDAFQRWYPASLTKLMTAYTTFRAIKAGELALDSPILVTRMAAAQSPSKMGFKPGTVITLDNALKMMLVKSANDIAEAIAENVGGSREQFAARMNAEAARLGMTGSHFINPHGLPEEGQYSTARDLAVLVMAIRSEFPEYSPYFSIEAIGLGTKVMPAFNLLIGRFAGADGMKTGFICSSGFNLIGTATRDGRTLAAIVLGEMSLEGRTDAAADLLAKGFGLTDENAPRLADLQPYGEGRDVIADIREEVCTKKAAADRADGRDENGKLIFKSPNIIDIKRDPLVVMVSTGGATGPVPLNQPVDLGIGKVPVPSPRPDPASVAAAPPKAAKQATADKQSSKPVKKKPATPVAKPAAKAGAAASAEVRAGTGAL